MLKEQENTPEYEKTGILIEVAECIVEKMQSEKMSRTGLAKRMHTNRAFVTRVLQCKENLTIEQLVQFAIALGDNGNTYRWKIVLEKVEKFTPRQKMLLVTGTKAYFKCQCGCNVFTEYEKNSYRCNCCDALYGGEK